MKKLIFIATLVVMALCLACSSNSYNPTKCEEIVNQNVNDLSESDVLFMIDQCDILLGQLEGKETVEDEESKKKFEMLQTMSLAIASYTFNHTMRGEKISEKITKRAEEVFSKYNNKF